MRVFGTSHGTDQTRVLGSVAAVLALVLMSGCGDDNGGSGGIGAGRFVDSPVQGLRFVCGNQSGMTGADGEFTFEAGHMMTFSVGSIILGQGEPAELMTPVSLVSIATDETDPTVTNISRFLQTIDDDAYPQNGIQITELVRAAAESVSIDFAQLTTAFGADEHVLGAIDTLTSVTTAGKRPLVSPGEAQDHLKSVLLARFIGHYVGTYTGEDEGNWQIDIDEDGTITGTGFPLAGLDDFLISGDLSSSGAADFLGGTVAIGAFFTGTITETGTISGTWVHEYYGLSGEFSGQRE